MKGIDLYVQQKYEILCKLNLSQNNITVNDVIRAMKYQLKNVVVEIIGSTIDNLQDFTVTTISHTTRRNIALKLSDNISINHGINKFNSILIYVTKVKSGSNRKRSRATPCISCAKEDQ